MHLQLGVTALGKHLFTCAARTWDGHKTQAQPSLHLCRVPKNLNLSGLDGGSACNPGPASDHSWQSNLELEQCGLGKHTRHEQGQTQCARDTGSTPHTCQCYLLTAFLPPQSTTEQVILKKLSTTSPLAQGRN